MLFHAHLNPGILSPKRVIFHPEKNPELLVTLCLIGLMIRKTCEKFQTNTSSAYVENRKHLHANFYLRLRRRRGSTINRLYINIKSS